MTTDGQEQKMAQALEYNYDGDSRWQDYWNNILMPENMASNPDVRRRYQLKYYQRYIDSELKVEAPKKTASYTAPPEPERPANQESSRPRPQPSSRPRSQPTAAATAAPAAGGSFRLDRQSIQFLANAWVVVMAVVAIFPFVPRGLGDRAYRFALLGTAVACSHSLYSAHGTPRSWNWQGLQAWLQSVVMGADFLHLLYCIAFASSYYPIRYAVVPVACRALEKVVPYLKRNFSNTTIYRNFLAKPCTLVESNTVAIRQMSANVEVGLGFLLIFNVITPQRNLVQTLVYWQLLKLKYQSPVSSANHRQAWSQLNNRVMPLIHRFAPFLRTPIGYVQNWFLRTG
ncbi:hypothetical protein R1flu_028622 [Riccia fluitans]|uniref:Uncharacterized protein n=1 Tax=Riccia fluitans TaxID=41844 RepID=A0ABD1XMQ2_9MARC